MRAKLNDWNNGWLGIELGIPSSEIDHLVALLQNIKSNPEQHFHLSSDYRGDGGLGDIEIYIQADDEISNLKLSGLALAPEESKNEN
jgi:hypothetical protein